MSKEHTELRAVESSTSPPGPATHTNPRKKKWATKAKTGCTTCRFVCPRSTRSPPVPSRPDELLTLHHIESDASSAMRLSLPVGDAHPQVADATGIQCYPSWFPSQT